MKSLLIDFTGNSPMLTFDRTTAGFKAVVQKCLVNIATAKGSDPLYADRGTNLLNDATQGRLIDLNSAQHRSNFAAGDTLFFQRDFQESTDPDALLSVNLSPASFDGQTLNFDAVFVSVGQETIGVNTSL